MIEYSRVSPDFVAAYKDYGQLYRDEAVHWPTPAPAEDLLKRLADVASDRDTLRILEVGTGWGKFLTEFASHLRSRKPNCTILTRGLDANPETIAEANRLNPDSHWVCDTVQSFLADHERYFPGQRYDFILDKGGTTRLASESEAENVAEGLWSFMNDGAKYAYYIARNFYDVNQGQQIRGHWSRGWIDILKARFGSAENLSGATSGPYRFVFTKLTDAARVR